MKYLNNNAKSFMEYLSSITGMDTLHGKTGLSGEDWYYFQYFLYISIPSTYVSPNKTLFYLKIERCYGVGAILGWSFPSTT
jgi:hypothetical protein